METRHPTDAECIRVHALVQAIVDEIYGGLWSDAPLHIDDEDWSQSWIAVDGAALIGVVLTRDGWVEDLWISTNWRQKGVGSRLLAVAEAEIAGRGFHAARLRVVSVNRHAIGFYRNRGWKVANQYPHERYAILMTEMRKDTGA